jgi:hypothetical protein
MKAKALVVVSLFLSCATFALAQFEHPDLKSGKKQVRSMVLMPVQVEITKVGMKGAEPMMEESRQTEQALTPVIGTVLHNLGYKLDMESLSRGTLEKDPDLRYTVDDLQKKFDEELKQMNRKSKDVRKGRFTLGDEVAKLPAGEKVDALLFVRAEGEVLTGGKKAFGWLVTGAAFDTAMMHFGVVDARTGDVLYFAKPVMVKNIAKKSEEAAGSVKKSFKNFVKASPAGAAPTEVAETPAKP